MRDLLPLAVSSCNLRVGAWLVPAGRKGYLHKRIRHASKVYVIGKVHTNTIEGFWSLVKRGIGGVYHSVSDKYLQSYLDEYSFRYNHRKDAAPMFTTVLSQVQKVSRAS